MTASPGPVASAVRAELARRGHTQRQAAEQLGLSQTAISVRLRGKKDFAIGELTALAAWLNVEISVLLGEPTRLDERPRRRSRPTSPSTQAIPA